MKWLIFLTMITSGALAFADRPEDHIVSPANFTFEGKTIEEKKIRWVWLQLPAILTTCYHSDECGLTEQEKTWVNQMLNNGRYYYQTTVQFISEKEKPNFFTSDKGETHRIAMTGLTPDIPLYINSDRLTKNGESLGFAFWAGLLTHELMHHLGIEDDAKRLPDLVGAKIAKAFEKAMVRTDVPEDRGDLQVYVLNFPAPATTSLLRSFPKGISFRSLIVDRNNIYNFSALEKNFELQPECRQGLRVITQLTPMSVRINPQDKPAGVHELAITYQGQALCVDLKASKVELQTNAYQFNFSLDKNPDGHYSYNLTTPSTWGLVEERGEPGAAEEALLVQLSSPEQVQAGGEIVVRARLKAPKGKPIVACGGAWAGPSWPQFKSGLPLGIYNESCELKALGDDFYEIAVHKKVPASTPAMKVELLRLCLSPGDPDADGCYFAFPKKRTFTNVVNNKTIAPAKILKVDFKRARLIPTPPEFTRYFAYNGSKTVDLEVTVENANDLEQAFFEGFLLDPNDQQVSFGGPLMTNDLFFVKSVRKQVRGKTLVVLFEVQLPREMNAYQFKGFKFDSITLLTPDFQALQIEFAWRDFALFIQEMLPKGHP